MRSLRWKVIRALNKLGIAMKAMSIASLDSYEILIVRLAGRTVTFIFSDEAVEVHMLLPNVEIDITDDIDIVNDHLRIRRKTSCDPEEIVEAYKDLDSIADRLLESKGE